jgi:retinol dehydrogenase-12
MTDLAGKTFFVTGASSGIGWAVARTLAARGADLVLATRSREKTQPLLETLRKTAAGTIEWIPLDLADLRSVANTADAFLQSGKRLDVLINNAGQAGATGMTRDGFEITIGTNHLGPFLLTARLLPKLSEAPQGRLVNVASASHYGPKAVDWTDVTRPANSTRDRLARYGLSKLFNVIHARELARRLAGTTVTTYSLHPGVVASDIWRELPWIVQRMIKLFMISNEEGAKEVLHCATSPELARSSGKYFTKLRERPANPLADDTALAAELFRRSEEAIAQALRPHGVAHRAG